jgi:hypothetical protein
MRKDVFKTALPLMLIMALLASPACIFDPKEDPVIPPDKEVPWLDMTNRDDVTKTMVLTYENRTDGGALSKYNGLLHNEYFFGLAPGDVGPGDPSIMTRAVDIESAEYLFDPNKTAVLELTITPEEGSWYEYPEIEGQPCENCYGTERQYFIRAQFGDETTIYQSPPGRAFAVFIIAPDENDPTKWVLRAMYDLGI